jgi:hypothetical protein
MTKTFESIADETLGTVTGAAADLPVFRAGNPLPNSGTGPQIPTFVAGRRIQPQRIPIFTSGRQTGWLDVP